MSICMPDTCSICSGCAIPAPFTNTASVSGQYFCSSGCRGGISAVSAPVVTEVVDVTLDKTVCPTCVRAGRSVRYTITICNRSSVPVSRVRITDPALEKYLDVEAVYYNGQCIPDACLCRGVVIPGIGAGCCAAVTVDAAVPAGATGPIANVAYADFEFDSTCGLTLQSAASNEVTLNIVSPSLEIEKEADRCSVTAEDNVITYTLTARNTGACPIENTVITDVLPTGLTYVSGSTTINGGNPVNLNPAAGINVGTLTAGGTAVITFRASAAV